MKTKGGRRGGYVAKRKGGLRKRGLYGRRKGRLSRPDVASLSVSTNLSNLNTNQMYSRLNTSLDQFARAVQVAEAYQFYKITGITIKLTPRLDTYIGGGASTVPYVYYMVDKSGSLPSNISVGNLIQMGAKPIRFDDKTVTIKWRPSVVQDVAFSAGGAPAGSSPAQYKLSPWLNTNANFITPGAWTPSTVDHLGVYWIVETSGSNSLYDAIVTVDFAFKKPLVNIDAGQPAALAV